MNFPLNMTLSQDNRTCKPFSQNFMKRNPMQKITKSVHKYCNLQALKDANRSPGLAWFATFHFFLGKVVVFFLVWKFLKLRPKEQSIQFLLFKFLFYSAYQNYVTFQLVKWLLLLPSVMIYNNFYYLTQKIVNLSFQMAI